jgi:RNA polymerase sigma factor (sigma-70 family)
MLLQHFKLAGYYWQQTGVTSTYSDIEIIEGCRQQQRKAQGYLYNKYYSDFMKICLRYANSMHDAEQWLNDGFYKIFTKINLYDGKGSFEGWMKRVLINTCLDNLKANKKHNVLLFTDMSENPPALTSAHIGNDALHNLGFKEIIMVLQQIPETHRTVFNLSVFEGYTHKEIAESLGIKEGTSFWYMNQARELLKQKISEYQLKAK